MKNLKKVIVIASLGILSTASAIADTNIGEKIDFQGFGVSENFDGSRMNINNFMDARFIRESINGEKDINTWLKDNQISMKSKALSLQLFVKDNPKHIRAAEDLMMQMIKDDGRMQNSWRQINGFIPDTVMANDNLIDLDRPSIGKTSFSLIRSGNTLQLDPDLAGVTISDNYLSRTAMRLGKAPVGPDGQPVVLCRMFPVSNAAFYEMSHNQYQKFTVDTQSNMTKDQACLNYESAESKYWKMRLIDYKKQY